MLAVLSVDINTIGFEEGENMVYSYESLKGVYYDNLCGAVYII